MASGALPTSSRHRKDSRASSRYQPRRPRSSGWAGWTRAWDWRRYYYARGRARMVVLVLVLLVVVLMVPLPALAPTRNLLLGFLGFLLPTSFLASPRSTPARAVLRYIDPLIGTANGGHVFPGASMPYGMAKPVADSVDRRENAAGFVQDLSLIRGFSQLHDSGTGGSPSMGNFPVFVHPGCPDDDLARCAYAAQSRPVMRWPYSAVARPGFFSMRLKNSVAAEMTASHRTSLYRFTFPDRDAAENGDGVPVVYSPLVLVDLQDLDNTRSGGGVTVDPAAGRITGQGEFRPSFGTGRYDAYFCADVRGAPVRRSGTFMGDKPNAERQALEADAEAGAGGFRVPAGSAGAWIQLGRPPGDEVLVRVGVSFLSRAQACANAEREIPRFDFAGTVRRAEDAWADKMAAVEVDETDIDPSLLVTFWSGLYRTMLSPQDYTGENPLWDSKEPYFDSFYCIWDSFRAQHPLLTIIDPVEQTRMVRTLIDIYRFLGKLPDCRMSFSKGFSQGGSNADVVIGDAFLKGISEGVDWKTAYEAVVSDAEVEPPNWNVEGRGNLVSYHSLGYIPWDDVDSNGTGRNTRSISRTVEYAYEDFAIALLAKGLGRDADHRRYMARSTNWRNLWNPQQEDVPVPVLKGTGTGTGTGSEAEEATPPWSDFRGFLQPRLLNGSFVPHDTRLCSPVHEMHKCYLDTRWGAYEGSPWLYSFYVPQDMAGLIRTMGGPDQFTQRLQYFHESGLIYMGNEQSFLPVFQFHYAGRPALSSHWAHRYIPALFNTTFAGVPGNDDCAMGAFSALAMMGFFPVAGQDVYLLTPPFFREVKVRARSGRWAVLRVVNFDPTYAARYIQSARLDGRPYARSWITHDFFLRGGLLELVVGEREGSWGTDEGSLPPSWPWPPSGEDVA